MIQIILTILIIAIIASVATWLWRRAPEPISAEPYRSIGSWLILVVAVVLIVVEVIKLIKLF